MITLLRKIRKRLISKGSFTSYLLYALGEILLVVAGILIALQINNWNEIRKTKNLNKSLLQSIKGDLKLDLEQIEFNERHLNTYEKAGLNIWNFLENKTSGIDTSQLERDFMSLQLFREFSPTKTAYENLLSNGVLNLIRNENIPRLLATYHNESPFNQRSKEQRSRLSNEYDPFRIKYIQTGMLRDYLKEQIFTDTSYSSKNYQVDWKQLKKDKEYRYLLDQIIAMRIPARWRLVKAREDIGVLISAIEKEIRAIEN